MMYALSKSEYAYFPFDDGRFLYASFMYDGFRLNSAFGPYSVSFMFAPVSPYSAFPRP